MDQFTVPQFIENEDKILGPVSVRQFGIMLVGAGLIFLVYQVTDFILFIILAVIIGAASAVLGFYQVNGQPFHLFLLHLGQTVRDPSLRVWHHSVTKEDLELEKERWKERMESQMPVVAPATHRGASAQKLAELSLVVDTGGAYKGEHDHVDELFQ